MADDKDDLMGDIRAAMQENAGETPDAPRGGELADPGAPAPAPEGDRGEAAARARDEAGRFAKAEAAKTRETLTLKEKPGAPDAAPVRAADASSPSATPPQALAPEIDKEGKHFERIPPPSGWKGAAKVDWDRMPRNVREAVAADYAGVEQARAELAPLKELFDVNREFLINQAGSVVEAQRQMMQFARMSVDNPVQLAEHILRARGLDPRAVFNGQPQAPTGGQQLPDQATIALLVQQQLEPILGQFQQQSLNQEISKVQAFRNDPAHPYFNDVAPRIEGLLKAGAAKDLQDAYDQAIWADPTIRQQLMSAQAEEAKKAHAADVAKANQARAASLRGSPLPGAPMNGSGGQSGSVADDVRAAMAEIAGA